VKGGMVMLLYHGSDVVVETPKIFASARTLDFGSGFYTTTNSDQAIDFDIEQAKSKLSVLEFYSADEEWLDFVSANRMGKQLTAKHDIVIGSVANDTVYRVFGLYENGLIDKETALKQLKIQKLYNQVVFCSETALLCLTFIGTLDAKEMSAR